MKKYVQILLIFLFSAIFYIPIFTNPSIFINRGNDMTQFFWPIFYFVRENIFKYHQIPFWNNLFFSGTPLLPDPQAPFFYLPNIIILFLNNIDAGFIVSVFLHIFVSGLGMYYLSKKGFNFSAKTSLFCSFIYIASPKLSGYIEAGHFGLITSWAWLPLVFLITILLAKKPTLKKSILLSIALSGIFFSHILIFIITAIAASILFLFLILEKNENNFKKLLYFSISGIICFGLISIAFLPQLAWQNETTRNLLLNSPDVYPKWNSIFEFIKASISPILFGSKFIWNLDTEKTIALGFFTILFSFIGFLKLNTKNKIAAIFSVLFIALISLNNLSPFYNLLIKNKFYILLRVSTRFWFLIIFIIIYLAGKGFENLTKIKKIKFLIYTFSIIAVAELLLTSWTKILKPIAQDTSLAPQSVYRFLSEDKTRFRVFCLNRCLSQKESAIYHLELADGYGTLQQKNYYEYSEQLSQSFYRNRYTLSIPPFEIFEYEDLQPYSPNLASFNIKYIISNHLLTDKNLKLVKQIDNYLIYENTINISRSNYPISFYSPNLITINTSLYKSDKLILSEVYNKDWHAYINGKTEIKIKETADKTREVDIPNDTSFVEFIYEPISFKIGLAITLATIFSLLAFTIINILEQKQNHTKN